MRVKSLNALHKPDRSVPSPMPDHHIRTGKLDHLTSCMLDPKGKICPRTPSEGTEQRIPTWHLEDSIVVAIPLPSDTCDEPLAIIGLRHLKLLPASIDTCTNHHEASLVKPPNDALLRLCGTECSHF